MRLFTRVKEFSWDRAVDVAEKVVMVAGPCTEMRKLRGMYKTLQFSLSLIHTLVDDPK